ncbi:hypothetical protein HMPREF0216_03457 [Clostridium celatum DSM 1785]|uniref:Uncharacterized protein n=1 Tax=Clostridium celatum DSM 1785 TaxID=545697 RepID=L1Q3E1_9CLOT|nr:hypothetical protein HMPREF0216_03457 [Clostridium celatum DSM 1785]
MIFYHNYYIIVNILSIYSIIYSFFLYLNMFSLVFFVYNNIYKGADYYGYN